MRLQYIIAFLLAAQALPSGAKADQLPVHAVGNAVVQTASVTQEVAQLAALVTVIPAVIPAEIAMPAPLKLASEPAARAPGDRTRARHHADRLAGKSGERHADKTAAGLNALCVRPIGKPETGTAAWYGGRYVGRRTSSGSRLDTIHPTAAHRSLPLNSLARVTNLDNGRSVIVRVTDRGPVSTSLLIDMSPRAATELHMKHAGLVPVSVEQVVEVLPDSK